MPDEPEIPKERLYEALDLMVEAGWITKYVRDPENMTVHWTEPGKQAMAGIFMSLQELGPEKLNQELWWAVAFIAHLRFGPGGGGFRDIGIAE